MKLFHKLMVLVAVVGMVPLATAGYLLIGINQDALETVIQDRRIDAAQHHSRFIDEYLSTTADNIETAIFQKGLWTMEPGEAEKIFTFLITQYGQIRTFFLIDANRRVIASANLLEPGKLEELDAYLANLPNLDAVFAGDAPRVFSNVYAAPQGGENRVILAIRNPEAGMVACAEISLDRVQSIVQKYKIGARGYAFLVDARGELIAHHEPERALQRESMLGIVDGMDQLLEARATGSGEFTDRTGELILESHQPLETVPWTLFVQEPRADAFAASSKMRTVTILLIVGAVLLGLSGGLLLTRAILRPIYQLLHGTREYGKGNLSYRLGEASRDEIGELARAFDGMGDSLLSRDRQLGRINETAKSLSSILDMEPLLDEGFEAIRTVVPATRTALYLEKDGRYFRARADGWDPPEEIDSAPGPLREESPGGLYVPLTFKDHQRGFLFLDHADSGETFAPDHQRFVEIIASAMTLSILNIELLAESVEKTRMQLELETAEVVQRTLIPREELNHPALELSGYIRSASETGGDWYGFLRDPDSDRISILIGDVTGHGVSAAMVTAAANSGIRSIEALERFLSASRGIRRDRDFDAYAPGNLLAFLNRIILASSDGSHFMTFFAATYDPATRRLTFANAGHDAPYYYVNDPTQTPRKRLTVLQADGPRLGDDPAAEFPEESVTLRPGDLVLWYTDGLPECVDKEGAQFGERRIRRLLSEVEEMGATAIKTKLIEAVEAFRGETPLNDDITILVGRVPIPVIRFVTDDPGPIEDGVRMLRDHGIRVEIGPESGPADWSVVPAGSMPASAGNGTAFIAGEELNGAMKELQKRSTPILVFGQNGAVDGRELFTILDAAVRGRGVDVRELCTADVEAGEIELHSSMDRRRVSEAVLALARSRGAKSGAIENLKVILAELMLNAFYDAPRDFEGRGLYLHKPRSEPVSLREPVRVRALWQDERVYLSVIDPFGSLKAADLIKHLSRGYSSRRQEIEFGGRPQGAGLGLSMAYASALKMFVNIDPGRSTEVTCLVDLRAARRKAQRWVKSLHLFVKGEHHA